jgi:multiple sugar transport system substrate-binding protein
MLINPVNRPRHIIFVVSLIALLMTFGLPSVKAATTVRILIGIGTGLFDWQIPQQQALIKEWNATHPDIQISLIFAPHRQARAIMLAQATAGIPPDIVGPIGIEAIYLRPDIWADLTPFITRDKAELNLDDFDKSASKALALAGGRHNGLALGIYPTALFVNEDIFARAKVPLPPLNWGQGYVDQSNQTALWDWDTLAKVSTQLTSDTQGRYITNPAFDRTKIRNFGFSDIWLPMRTFAAGWGPQDAGLTDDGKTATLNQPAYLNALRWRQNAMFNQYFMPDEHAFSTLDNTDGAFQTGRIGIAYAPSWLLCCTRNPRFKWNVYAAPAVPGTDGKKVVSPTNIDTFMIVKSSKRKEEAWQVLKWLLSKDNSARLCLIYGCVPARLSARTTWESSLRSQYPKLNSNVFLEALAFMDIPNSESPFPQSILVIKVIDFLFYRHVNSNPNFDIASNLNMLNYIIQSIYVNKGK